MRIISDMLYARIVKELLKNESVATFQELLLSEKSDEVGGAKADDGEAGK